MMSTPLVTTFMMFFQIFGNFIAFVIGCDYNVKYSTMGEIQEIGSEYIAHDAMKRNVWNASTFWWLPSMYTQLMRDDHSNELNFMHNWEVYATLWCLPSCVINNIRLWGLWSMELFISVSTTRWLTTSIWFRGIKGLSILEWLPLIWRSTPHCGDYLFVEGCPMGHYESPWSWLCLAIAFSSYLIYFG